MIKGEETINWGGSGGNIYGRAMSKEREGGNSIIISY